MCPKFAPVFWALTWAPAACFDDCVIGNIPEEIPLV
jgi:hypothetical protein